MAREETLKDVETGEVGTVVQGYVDDEAREVRASKKSNGKFDVTARFES